LDQISQLSGLQLPFGPIPQAPCDAADRITTTEKVREWILKKAKRWISGIQ
jgi:hypothetical protein